jgi:hypothetical protein
MEVLDIVCSVNEILRLQKSCKLCTAFVWPYNQLIRKQLIRKSNNIDTFLQKVPKQTKHIYNINIAGEALKCLY